jgi:hypothetical protein
MTCVVQNWPSGSLGFPPVSINRSFWHAECENLVSQTQDKAAGFTLSFTLSLSLALSLSRSLALSLSRPLSLSLVTKGQAEVGGRAVVAYGRQVSS